MTTEAVLAELQKIENLANVPESELNWLIEHSEIQTVAKDEHIFVPGDEAEYMSILLQGRVRFQFKRGNNWKTLNTAEPGAITGLLPYSRMKHITGYARAAEDTVVLGTHKDQFKALINECPQLTEALVHVMTTRVREFTKSRQQDEKLLSLGKLSAGLAHELNNPASAIVRGARAMREHLKQTPERFKGVMRIKLSEDQIGFLNDLLFSKLEHLGKLELSALEKSDLEMDLLDWLDDRDVEDSDLIAEALVDSGWTVEDLDDVVEQVTEEYMPQALNWMYNVTTSERLVNEIDEAANRISDLVKSVKTYTHMDRGDDMEKTDLHSGLRSTLTMLNHKIKGKNIEVVEDFDFQLPKIPAHPGELNQVWTNLIDNAIDAMEHGGRLEIKTWPDNEFARVDVIDNGSGIPEDVKLKIFDPFFTTKEMGQGTGLGLDVVRKIVETHRADIKVDSEPGRTAFKLCFPTELPKEE